MSANGVAPTLVMQTSTSESIRGMQSGSVTSSAFQDLIVTTYSGKVLAITTDPAAADATGAALVRDEEMPATAVGAATALAEMAVASIKQQHKDVQKERAKDKERRLKALQKEVEGLKMQVDKEKARYKSISTQEIAVAPQVKISSKFRLCPDEACYLLALECQSALDLVALRGDLSLDLLEDPEGAILSRQPGTTASPTLATYRCVEESNRIQIKLRTPEGTGGSVSCFVVPQVQPRTAQLVNLPVPPLSLHERVADMQVAEQVVAEVPLSDLSIKGPFSLPDMHQWLSLCVSSGMPPRPADDEMVLFFRSVFVGTVLSCRYSKGLGFFRSDSPTTLTVLKEVITREATARQMRVKVSVDLNEESTPHVLHLLHPKVAYQQALTQSVRLVEPLRELQLQDGEVCYLQQDMKEILDQGNEILRDFERQPRRLNFLHQIVTDLYRHKWRLKGHSSVEHRLPALQRLLASYDFDSLVKFFEETV